MQDFKKRRKAKRFVYSKTMVLLLLVLCALLANAAFSVYKKSKDSKMLAVRAGEELYELEEKERILREGIERLNTREGIEEEVRTKFNVTRPDEKLVIIVDDGKTPPAEDMERGLWDKVLDFFGIR